METDPGVTILVISSNYINPATAIFYFLLSGH